MEDVRVTIGGQKVLTDITLPLSAGVVTAVIGGDDAGKTTLCRVLVGLEKPTSGEVRVPPSIGYQPAGSGTWGDLTVTENLQFMADAHRLPVAKFSPRLETLLAATGLEAAADRLAADLSGGMRQKLGVAMALLPEPSLLVLDEPTTGVDPVSRAELWRLISGAAAEGAAVMMTTTYLDEARRTGRILALEEGQAAASGVVAEVNSVLPVNRVRGKTLVEADQVSKKLGSVIAVDGMSLEVRAGEVVGLLGGNGAGKTTLIRCLLSLALPESGTVRVLGRSPNREVLRQVGYMPQGLGLYSDLSASENLDFRRRIYGVNPELDEWPESFGNRPVGSLPLGAQRRVAFAAALAQSPRLLVLDEPTSGVGPRGRTELWATIKDAVAAGAGALVTTHHLEEAEHCDRLVMMACGREVAAGSLADVIGGRMAVVVEVGDQTAGYQSLSEAGFPVVLDGNYLRLTTNNLASITQVLSEAGISARVRQVPATLEETFVALAQ